MRDARIALGGVAHEPWRARAAEEACAAASRPREAFAAAADAELERRRSPCADNAFKVPLARNVIVRTLSELTA